MKLGALNLLDRYILREWLRILALAVGATFGLIMMETIFQDLHDLLEHGAAIEDIFTFIVVRTPSFLALVIPIVLLVSLLYALGEMHRRNEITAMRAAGLSLFQITRSIWLVGICFCGLTWWLNASVVPWSVEATRALADRLQYEYQAHVDRNSAGVSHVVTFDNERLGRMWVINRYNRFAQRAYGVMVTELDAQRREKAEILAREARFDPQRECWIFTSGRETWIDPETQDIVRTVPFDEKVKLNYTEDPQLMLIFDLKPSDLSFFELQRIIDYFRIEENPKVTMYAVKYYGILAETVSPLIILAIAIPFAVTGVRVNPAVGVSKSMGLFVLYFVFLKFATVLGTRGVLSPMLAAWIPNLAMGIVGVWVFWRRR